MIQEHSIRIPDLLKLLNRPENAHTYASCISQISEMTAAEIDLAVVYTTEERIIRHDTPIDAITIYEFQIWDDDRILMANAKYYGDMLIENNIEKPDPNQMQAWEHSQKEKQNAST